MKLHPTVAWSALGIVWIGCAALAATTGAHVWHADPKPTVEQGVAALRALHYDEARRDFEALARSGNPDAAIWIAHMDVEGLGAAPNGADAVTWLTKAADRGSAPAARRLGEIYQDGRVVLQNLVEARQWLGRAADAGDATAQRDLGEIYAKGVGAPKDLGQAYVWLDLAASGGDATAASERDRLVASLSPDALNRAEGEAKTLQQRIAARDAPRAAGGLAETAPAATAPRAG